MPELPPSPPSDHESVFQYLSRHVALLKDREAHLGAYAGDGLTAVQANELLEKIRVVVEWPDGQMPVSPVWDAFRAAVDAEATWVFEDLDPIGVSIIWALRQIQGTFRPILEDWGIKREDIQNYVDLSVLQRAIKRRVSPDKEGFSPRVFLGTLLATILYRLGSSLKAVASRLRPEGRKS